MRLQRSPLLPDIISSFLMGILLVPGGLSTAVTKVDQLRLVRLAEVADMVCPYNVICREGPPRLTLPNPEQTGCCTDCSCLPDCGLTESCCYPSLDIYQLVDRSEQECVYIASDQTIIDIFGYNMVANGYPNGYPNGSGADCGTADVPCGQDNTATVLGALYPVSSKKTGRIYKNVKCAKCHGLREEHVTYWEAYIVCELWHGVDVSTFFQFFVDGNMDTSCHFRFFYPGSSSDLLSERCFSKARACLPSNDFKIPDGLNMSRGEIIDACNSDLRGPTFKNGWNKNVFCQICNRYGEIPLSTCKSNRHTGEEKVLTHAAFSALINFGDVRKRTRLTRSETLPVSPERLACSKKDNYGDCRMVNCPSGQVRLDTGECKYPAKNWNTYSVSLNLKLFPKQAVTVSAAQRTQFYLILTNRTLSVSPWPKKWVAEMMLYNAVTNDKNISIINYFIVRIYLRTKTVNANSLMADIQSTMGKDWLLYIQGSHVRHRQQFSEYTEFAIYSRHYVLPDNGGHTGLSPPSFVLNLTLPVFQSIIDRIPTQLCTITKMFFCEQVLLKQGEYEYDYRHKLMYFKPTRRVFFPGEIASVYDPSLGYVPRLCIDDANFSIQVSDGEHVVFNCWLFLISCLQVLI